MNLTEKEMREVYELLIDDEEKELVIDEIKSCIERYGEVEECMGIFQACIPKKCFASVDADDIIISSINNMFKGYKVPFVVDTNNVYKIISSVDADDIIVCFDTGVYGAPLPKYW